MPDGKEGSGQPGERIAKVIARAGLASRREAEAWIAAGRVAVNGTVIATPAHNVTAADRVTVDGEPLPKRERTRLYLYHKPRGLVTTHTDPQGRPTIFQRLPKHLPRLISVGRLDFNTEGLILLTNDGGLARVLELPATGWLRRYRVRAHGAVTQASLDQLRQGATVDGIRYGPIEATLDRVQGSNLWLTLAIREGKNREVRNVLGDLGLTVARLIRVSFGPFQLGELAEGAVEEVRTRVLREQLGERLVALSGADFSTAIAKETVPASSDFHRHPEVAAKGPSKDARPERTGRHPSRLASLAPQGDGPREFGSRAAHRSKSAHPSHSWRAREDERPAKKLRRKFRGSRREDRTAREETSGKLRAGLLTDRKGRRVVVERFQQESSARESAPPPQGRSRKPYRGPPGRHRPRRPRRGR
jgi:23S rRNA pseudouridine2605 synthase